MLHSKNNINNNNNLLRSSLLHSIQLGFSALWYIPNKSLHNDRKVGNIKSSTKHTF